MRNLSWFVGTTLTATLWLSISCGDGPSGQQPTVASSVASSSSATSGSGGAGSGGDSATSSGSGGDTGSGGDPAGGGGAPPDPVHGCLYSTAVDMTGMDPVNINIPNGSYCVRMSQGAGLTFTLASPTQHRYLGGTYDDATQIKAPDLNSPIQSSCDTSPYTCSPAVTAPPYTMSSTGEFPWYDDKNPGSIRGVVYVD